MTTATTLRTARDQDRIAATDAGLSVFRTSWRLGLYFWSTVVIVTAVVSWLIVRTGNDVDGSLPDGVLGSGRYFLSVLGLILVIAMLPVRIAAGSTRRALSRGLLVAGVAVAATFALLGALLMLATSWVYDARGWSTVVAGDAALYGHVGDVAGIWLTWAVLNLAYFVAGAGIAVVYYRYGVWWGSVFTAGLVVLVAGVEAALRGWPFGSAAAGVGLAVLLTAVLAAIVHALVRRIGVLPFNVGISLTDALGAPGHGSSTSARS